MTRLAGKIALVTGAASGIGRGTAQVLAAEGAEVIAVDRDELDVTDPAAWLRVIGDIAARHGRLDVLVNAAGIAVWDDIERATLDDWRRVHAVNAEGTFLGCQAAIAVMKATGGSIINISSVAGIVADANAPAYCASKAAVRLLTKSVALHCARKRYGIRCNSVHPSFIATPMVDAVIAAAPDPARMQHVLEHAAPLGRMGAVEDVAYAILYLASDESKFVTGTELVIDGGLTAR